MESALNLLPRPQSVLVGPGRHHLGPEVAINGDRDLARVVRRLLSPGTGLDLAPADDGSLVVRRDPGLADEAYRLEVTPDRIVLEAATTAGMNWAAQTLRQLVGVAAFRPAPLAEALSVPCVRIEDEPRFGWRGIMLDVGRHFRPLADVFRFVDLAALHKYNVFHLHLTEDQGWRFASERYPRLAEIASWRTETRFSPNGAGDGTRHGGYYSQDQLRALVRYAQDRGITVVPELEFPGHARAVLAAYPELGNHPERERGTATGFGVFPEVLSLSAESLAFVFDIYSELLDVFPSRYIHVGGDEVPREEWVGSAQARLLAAERGLPGPEHLQQWFTGQLRDWLTARGRRLVGWDEINDEGPLSGAVTMAWRDADYGVKAAAAGLDVVMAPYGATYFDLNPGDPESAVSGAGPGWVTTTERVYAFDPLAGVAPEHQTRVLGTQCQLWTEYIPSTRRLDYLTYPRACAHAEVAWSDPAGRSWPEFQDRLAGHLERLAAMGVEYRPESGPLPWQVDTR